MAADSGLVVRDGLITRPGAVASLGRAETGLRALEDRWRHDRFDAPDRPTLQELGLDARGLATAEKLGRLLRIHTDIILAPDAPDAAVAALRELPQPFTVSAARQALATTRRVAVPLLEHLDRTGRTRRVDHAGRIVVEQRVGE